MTILAFSPVQFYGTSRTRKENRLPKYMSMDDQHKKRPAQFEVFSRTQVGKMFAKDFGLLFSDIIWSFAAAPVRDQTITELVVRQEAGKVIDEVMPDLVITFTRLQGLALQTLRYEGRYRNEHFHCDDYLSRARHEFIRHLKEHINGKASKAVGIQEET
jgi:hypothetical protein